MTHLRLALASLLVVGATAGEAAAHPLAPALPEIRETGSLAAFWCVERAAALFG